MIRYAIAKPEPLRVEHEAFRDAVLGKDGRHRHPWSRACAPSPSPRP